MEIRYAALIADKNIPHDTAKIIFNFFKDIGKDPNILQSISMARSKCSNLISNVLCPVETDHVVQNIQILNLLFLLIKRPILRIIKESFMFDMLIFRHIISSLTISKIN